MTSENLNLEKLEAVNDIIAQGIDEAGGASEVFLAKVAYYLATHYCEVDDLRSTVSICLKDLPD